MHLLCTSLMFCLNVTYLNLLPRYRFLGMHLIFSYFRYPPKMTLTVFSCLQVKSKNAAKNEAARGVTAVYSPKYAGVGTVTAHVIDCGMGNKPCPQAKNKICAIQAGSSMLQYNCGEHFMALGVRGNHIFDVH